MLIDVRDILKSSGLSKTVELEFLAAACGIESNENDCEFSEIFYVRAELSNIKGMIRAKGSIATGYDTYCARCLKKIHVAIDRDFDDDYVQFGSLNPVSADEAEVYEYSDKEIDIGRAVRDAVLLELPIRRLCSEDCLSLCQFCGKDLNEGPCGCEQPVGDIRFKVLEGFFDSADAGGV